MVLHRLLRIVRYRTYYVLLLYTSFQVSEGIHDTYYFETKTRWASVVMYWPQSLEWWKHVFLLRIQYIPGRCLHWLPLHWLCFFSQQETESELNGNTAYSLLKPWIVSENTETSAATAMHVEIEWWVYGAVLQKESVAQTSWNWSPKCFFFLFYKFKMPDLTFSLSHLFGLPTGFSPLFSLRLNRWLA